MENFENYLGTAIELAVADSRSQKNLSSLMNKMETEQNLQLWKLSADKKEYDRLFYLLSKGKDANGIDSDVFNDLLMEKGVSNSRGEVSVTVIHDPCYIRKPYSQSLENLDKVQDLSGNVINGYRTFNSVLVHKNSLSLLSCQPYSQKEKSEEAEGHLTNKEVGFSQIRTISKRLKADISDRTILHLMDREADDVAYFKLIDKELSDKFIFRLKTNRNSDVEYLFEKKDKEGKKIKESLKFVKIAKVTLANNFEYVFEKFAHKGKCYQQAKSLVSYERMWVGDDFYWIVKVEMKTRTGRAIFANPMILITNFEIFSGEVALFVYQKYLKRSKIEGVFKFLKEELGWEDFRVRDFIAIKNIILLGFFVGSYFCEREPELIKHPLVILVCDLAKSKGKVTKHFFMAGLAKLAQYQMTLQFFKDNDLSEEDIGQLLGMLK